MFYCYKNTTATYLLPTLTGYYCVYQNADVVVTLKNQIAELEEEKGSLQLQLLDTDESKSGQCCCCCCKLSLLSWIYGVVLPCFLLFIHTAPFLYGNLLLVGKCYIMLEI